MLSNGGSLNRSSLELGLVITLERLKFDYVVAWKAVDSVSVARCAV